MTPETIRDRILKAADVTARMQVGPTRPAGIRGWWPDWLYTPMDINAIEHERLNNRQTREDFDKSRHRGWEHPTPDQLSMAYEVWGWVNDFIVDDLDRKTLQIWAASKYDTKISWGGWCKRIDASMGKKAFTLQHGRNIVKRCIATISARLGGNDELPCLAEEQNVFANELIRDTMSSIVETCTAVMLAPDAKPTHEAFNPVQSAKDINKVNARRRRWQEGMKRRAAEREIGAKAQTRRPGAKTGVSLRWFRIRPER